MLAEAVADALAKAAELGVAPLARAAADALAAAQPQALGGELDAALAKVPAETVGGAVDCLLAEAAAVAWVAAPDWAFSSQANAALSLLEADSEARELALSGFLADALAMALCERADPVFAEAMEGATSNPARALSEEGGAAFAKELARAFSAKAEALPVAELAAERLARALVRRELEAC